MSERAIDSPKGQHVQITVHVEPDSNIRLEFGEGEGKTVVRLTPEEARALRRTLNETQIKGERRRQRKRNWPSRTNEQPAA